MIDYAAAREAMVDRQVRPAGRDAIPDHRGDARGAARGLRARGAAAGRLSRRARAAGAGAGAARPAGLRQAARRAGRRADATSCSTSAAASATRPRCWRGWPRRWSRSSPTRRWRPRPRRCSRRTRSTTPWCRPGRSPTAWPSTGRSTRSSSRARSRCCREALADQLKPGGRIAAIFVDGSRRPGPARARAPATASPGGVSSMQRPRCCRASPRRKHLSSDADPPDSAARKPGQRAGGASSARGSMMHRQALRSLLLSGTLAAALALGGGGRPQADSLADALVKAYQTSPLLESNRAALRGLDETVPQARADAAAAGRRLVSARRADDGRGPSRTSSTAPRRRSTPRSCIFDNGQTKAAVESARNTDRRRPRRPEGRRAAGALQRGAGLCRRAPRPGVRPARQQRRRPAERDAGRHPATASTSAR